MLARAARGAGVPVDRGGVGGAGGHGAGPAAPVPRRRRAGCGSSSPGWPGVLAVDPVPLDPAGSVLGDAVVAVAAAAAAAAGRWPGAHGVGLGAGGGGHGGVAAVPVRRVHAGSRGRAARLPWADGSTRVPLCPGRLLPVTLDGPAGAGAREGTGRDDSGRGGSEKARLERARETGLFRYSLVQELAEPGLSPAERGWRARELAGRVHDGPGGQRVTVSYSTLTRWRRAL